MSEITEINEEVCDIASETMLGDLRDALLNVFKHNKDVKPWKEMSQEEQQSLASDLEYACGIAIRKAVSLIASNGFQTIKGELEKVTIKDSYQCVVNVSKFIEQRHALADAAGDVILLTVASEEQFMGREEAETDPNQPELPVADACNNIPQEEAA